MRIACLQFAPRLGDIDNNLNRADAILSRADAQDLDLLVLPELAFTGVLHPRSSAFPHDYLLHSSKSEDELYLPAATGYNFKSLKHIMPYLEPTASGITSLWARTTALKYDCIVTVGYPEKVDITAKWPASPEYYNSAITVNAEGETIANYRKSFLFYSDETWALEGADGFFDGEIPGLGNVAMGICKWPTKDFERMDLNPYRFEAPWDAWEFAYHILHKQANIVILSMAWLTRQDASSYSREPQEPDMETLSYWIARLEPVIRAEDQGEIIVVLANRCGVEDEAVYAGTSSVLGINNGEVKLYGVLGRGEKELLVVDTSDVPFAKLVQDQEQAVQEHVQHTRVAPNRDSINRQDSEMASSIDAVLAETIPVSPVNAREPYSYFNAYPPAAGEAISKLKSSVGINDGFSPVAATFPASPDPNVYQPPSPRYRNSSQLRESEQVITEKRMKGLEITPVVGLGLEMKDPNEPDSASSLRVNTPWEKTSGFFRAEDITSAVKSSTPKSPAPTLSRVPPVPRPSPGLQDDSRRATPRTPVANGLESPKARDPSRSKPKERRHPPNLVVPERHDDITKSPIIVPVKTASVPAPDPAPNLASGTPTNRSILPQAREVCTSPRPQSTIW